MSKQVPDGWQSTTIGQITREICDGGTPSTSKPEYFGGHIPWVVIDDIKPRIYKTGSYITELGLSKSSARLWDSGTIILSTGATIGRVGVAMVPLATKQGICGVVPDDNVCNQFLYYYLASIGRELNSLAQGSTIKETRPPTIKEISLQLPPLPEQKKIAAILTALDSHIEALQGGLAKTQSLRQPLMQDLLTGKVRVDV